MRQIEARLEQVARQVQPHILHAHSPVLDAIPALRVGRRLGLPVVYEVRAFWEDAAVDHGTTTEGSPRYRMSRAHGDPCAAPGGDQVFTICEGLRRDIVSCAESRQDRVTVIPNAVDIEAFRFGVAPDERAAGAPGSGGCDR